MFKVNDAYTRQYISEMLGGSTISYLPEVGGRIVCGCLTYEDNPGAPEVILVGKGPVVQKSAEVLVSQADFIPMFVKLDVNRWVYMGDFVAHKSSSDPADLGYWQAKALRKDRIMRIIHMKRA